MGILGQSSFRVDNLNLSSGPPRSGEVLMGGRGVCRSMELELGRPSPPTLPAPPAPPPPTVVDLELEDSPALVETKREVGESNAGNLSMVWL